MAYPKKDDKDKHVKQNVSFPPDMLQRIIEYCEAEERAISWVIQKAVDAWLKERGF